MSYLFLNRWCSFFNVIPTSLHLFFWYFDFLLKGIDLHLNAANHSILVIYPVSELLLDFIISEFYSKTPFVWVGSSLEHFWSNLRCFFQRIVESLKHTPWICWRFWRNWINFFYFFFQKLNFFLIRNRLLFLLRTHLNYEDKDQLYKICNLIVLSNWG